MFTKQLAVVIALTSFVAGSAMPRAQQLKILSSRSINAESAPSSAANVTAPADSESKSDEVSKVNTVPNEKNSTQNEAPKKDTEHLGEPQTKEGDDKPSGTTAGAKNSTQIDTPKKTNENPGKTPGNGDDSGSKASGGPGAPKVEAGHEKSSGTSVQTIQYSRSLALSVVVGIVAFVA